MRWSFCTIGILSSFIMLQQKQSNSQQSGKAFFGKYEVRIARLDKVMVVNMERVSMVVFLGSMAGSWEGGPWQTTTGKEIQPRGGSWQENVTGKSSKCYWASTANVTLLIKNYVARTYHGVGYLFVIISKVKKSYPPWTCAFKELLRWS